MANVADQEVIELEVVIVGGTATVVNEVRGNSDKQRRVVHIKKFTNGQDADEAPGPTIAVGATVTWTYVVTNESPLAFTRMSVTDDRGVEVRCPRELRRRVVDNMHRIGDRRGRAVPQRRHGHGHGRPQGAHLV